MIIELPKFSKSKYHKQLSKLHILYGTLYPSYKYLISNNYENANKAIGWNIGKIEDHKMLAIIKNDKILSWCIHLITNKKNKKYNVLMFYTRKNCRKHGLAENYIKNVLKK